MDGILSAIISNIYAKTNGMIIAIYKFILCLILAYSLHKTMQYLCLKIGILFAEAYAIVVPPIGMDYAKGYAKDMPR